MRIGVVLATDSPGLTHDELVAQAEASEAAGLDVCLVRDGPWSAAAIAASLSAHTSALRLGLQLSADGHPVQLAEELAVVDQCLNGRAFGLLGTRVGLDELGESLDLLLAAVGGRPFRHQGTRWTVPRDQAHLVTVTPAPAQLELPFFTLGAETAHVAAARGIPPVLAVNEGIDAGAAIWSALESNHPAARLRWARPALRALPAGDIDTDALVDLLRAEQRRWRLDTCLLELPSSMPLRARLDTIRLLGTLVRPRLVLASLPDGVEAMWAGQVSRARRKASSDDAGRHQREGTT